MADAVRMTAPSGRAPCVGPGFTTAPQTRRVDPSPAEVVRRIEEAGAWLALHDIQGEPLYRRLVDEVLDSVRPRVEARNPAIHHRAGWMPAPPQPCPARARSRRFAGRRASRA